MRNVGTICGLGCFPKKTQTYLSCTYHIIERNRIGVTTIFELLVSTSLNIKLGDVYKFPVYETEITNNLLFLSDH